MRTLKRRRNSGVIFIVDFLFIISFYVLVEATPALRITFSGELPAHSFLLMSASDQIPKSIKGARLSFRCNDGVAGCADDKRIVIHGAMHALVSEIFLLSCAFERKSCQIFIRIGNEGRLDVDHFFRVNAIGPKIQSVLLDKFSNHVELIEKK